jgi:hypothetical protein
VIVIVSITAGNIFTIAGNNVIPTRREFDPMIIDERAQHGKSTFVGLENLCNRKLAHLEESSDKMSRLQLKKNFGFPVKTNRGSGENFCFLFNVLCSICKVHVETNEIRG